MTAEPGVSSSVDLARRLEVAEAAIDAGALAHWLRTHPDDGGAVLERGLARVLHGAGPDRITRIWCVGLDGPAEEGLIEDAVAGARRRAHERVTLEWNPYAHQSLIDLLAERRFVVQEFTNTFVMDPNARLPAAAHPLPASLRIERVDPADRSAVEAAAAAWATGAARPEPPDSLVQVGRQAIAQPARVTLAAYEADRIVGVGTVGYHEGVAFLSIASTIESHRRMGIQSHLLRARLAHARDHGADLVTIGADPGSPSERNVERLGFRCVYTKPIVRLDLG